MLAVVGIFVITAASGGWSVAGLSSTAASTTRPPQVSPRGRTAAPATAATRAPQSDQGLQLYIDGLNQRLLRCEVALATTQIALSQALESNATASAYARLYTTATQAGLSCSYPASAFATYNPPSRYPSLVAAAYGGFGLQVGDWAQNDSRTALLAVQAVAEDPGSPAAVDDVRTESRRADSDARAIELQLKAAAVRGHVTGFTSLGLPLWEADLDWPSTRSAGGDDERHGGT
jgi:hypothetical protein